MRRPLWRRALSLVFGGAALAAVPADAQPGDPNWSATLTIAPAPSAFISDWARNPGIAQLSVFYRGTTSETFRVEAVITERRRGELGRGISGLRDVPFGPYSALLTTQDLVDWAGFNYDPSVRGQIVRTGLLPEGDYRICARIRNQFGGALLTEACSEFRVAYPEAPQLIAPATGSGVSVPQPTFQWVPVQAPADAGVRYRLRIAKRQAGQAALVALQSNVPQHEAEIDGSPFYVYPLDALPLDTGATYVWRVETLTKDGVPFSAGGRPSEIWSFAWGPAGPGGPRRVADRPFSDTLTLVPNVARLRGLSRVNVTESDFDVRLEGAAQLELRTPTGTTITTAVDVRGLTIDRVAGTLGAITAGRVVGRLDAGRAPDEWRSGVARFTDVEFAPGSGVTLGGALYLGGRTGAAMRGRVALTAIGLDGVLTAETPDGAPLVRVGAGAVRLAVTGASLSYPAAAERLDGRLEIFGQPMACEAISWARGVGTEAWPSSVPACTGGTLIPVFGGPRTMLEVRGGSVRLSPSADLARLDVEGRFAAAFSLDAAPATGLTGATCVARFELAVAGDSAVAVPARDPCDIAAPLPMGGVTVTPRNVRLERFAWRAATGFDIAGLVDVQPAVRGLALPYVADARLTRDGVQFSEASAALDASPLDIGGYRVSFSRGTLAPRTWPWRDWQAGRADSLVAQLEGTIAFGRGAPSCASAALPLASAQLTGERLRLVPAERPAATPCALPAGGATIEATALVGALSAVVRDSAFIADTLPGVTGRVRWPAAWRCESGAATTALGAPLAVRGDGRPSGDVPVGDVACAAPLRPFPLLVRGGTLRLRADGDSTIATLQGGGAVAGVGASVVEGRGRVTVDVATARVIDGALDVTTPVSMALPRERPVLTFALGGFALSRDGVTVDGRQQLVLDDGRRIGVTFVGARLDSALQVTRGVVRFDTTFALTGPIAPRPVGWRAVAAGSALSADGVRIDWPATVQLDSAGLRGAGAARAAIRSGALVVTDAQVTTDAAFAFDVATREVRAGVATVSVAGAPVATITRDGVAFEPGAVARAVLPARLPVPAVAGAYLETRRGDSVLVVTEPGADGIRVRSRPGASVMLVLPSLASGGEAPRVPVTADLFYEGLFGRLRGGRVVAAEPARLAAQVSAASAGLPLVADSLALVVEAEVPELVVFGRPLVFGAAQGPAHGALLRIGADGAARMSAATRLGTRTPLVAGSAAAQYRADSIAGAATRQQGTTVVDLVVHGALELGNVDASRRVVPFEIAITERGYAAGARGAASGDGVLEVGGVRVRLADLTVPRFEWSAASGFDFEVALEGPLELPALGITTPAVRGLAIVPAGLAVPAVLVPELTGEAVTLGGFRVAPRALRIRRGLLPLATGGNPSGDAAAQVSVDLAIGFGALPAGASPALRELQLSALDVAFRAGRLVGRIEPRELSSALAIPLAGDGALLVRTFSGALGDSASAMPVTVAAGGALALPAAVRCAAGEQVSLGAAAIRLDAAARPLGTVPGVTLPCPVPMGRLAARLAAGALAFDTTATGEVRAILDGVATVALPTGGRDSVQASGPLGVDVLRGRVVRGAVRVDRAFRVSVPVGSPVLAFTPRAAVLDTAGLVLQGDAEVAMRDGMVAPVRFSNLALGLDDFAVRRGSATFPDGLGLGASLGQGAALTWEAVPAALVSASQLAADGFRLRLSDGTTLDAGGLHVRERVGAAVRIGDTRADGTATPAAGEVRIGTSPFGVASGRLRFERESQLIATLDSAGFRTGTTFATRAIPARLGLPDTAAAYVELQRDGAWVVQRETTDTTVRLFTRDGERVTLVVPSLAAGGAPLRVPATIDLTLDPGTLVALRGSVRAVGAADAVLATIAGAGDVPFEVTDLRYASGASGLALRAGGRVRLPAAFGGALVRLDTVAVTASGIAVPETVGRFDGQYEADVPTLATSALPGGVALAVTGVRWRPATASGAVTEVAARFTTPLFRVGAARAPLPVTARLSASGIAATVDGSAYEAMRLRSGQFELAPAAFGGAPAVAVTATRDAITLAVRGTLRMPQVNGGFAVSVGDVRIGTAGVTFPEGTDAGPASQEVRVFGGTLALARDGTAAGLALGARDSTLHMQLGGTLRLFGQRSTVRGLDLGGDGTVELDRAEAFTIVPSLSGSDPIAAVREVTAADGRLKLTGRVVLPAPFRSMQGEGGDFDLRLRLDGVADSTRIVVWSQAEGCCSGGGRTMVPLGPMAQLHARHLELAIDAEDVSRSSIALVADAYVGATDETRGANRIAFGSVSGGELRPGLRVGFDGSVTLGNVALLREFTFNFRALTLTVSQVAVPNTVTLSSAGAQGDGSPFAFVVGGALSLDVSAVQGSLAFQDVSIGTAGVSFAPTSLTSATLSVAGVLSFELRDLMIVTRDTTVSVSTSANGDAESITVRNLVMFGGRLTLGASGLSGGVERFLFYQTPDGVTALLIQGATLTIPNTLEFRADFAFRQSSDGFQMALGASGTLLEKVSVGLYGSVSQSSSDGFRIGMFLRSTVVIPILPGVVTVSELGAGFFYRPRDADIDGAWRAAGLDPSLRTLANAPRNPSAGTDLAFAVLLYGRIEIVSNGIASGRTLITVTARFFEVYADVTLLGRSGELTGSVRLQIGLQTAYAEGDIRIRVNFPGVVTGNAALGFFVYGANTWGIMGSLDFRVLGFLNASGKLFVGPPGFLVQMSVRAGFDVSILSVSASFSATVWYVRANSEFGGFASVDVRASLLGGAIKASAGLRGAFLVSSGNWLVYASAYLKVETALGDFEGSVWLKIQNGRFSGGLGRDRTMDRLIARARQVEEQMQGAAAAAQASLTEARNVASTIAVTTEALSAAFDQYQRMDEFSRIDRFYGIGLAERRTDIAGTPAWEALQTQYIRAVSAQLGSDAIWLQRVPPPDLDSLATALEATRGQVLARLRATSARVQALADAPFPAMPEDPLSAALPDSITAVAVTVDGREAKRVATMPTFAVDQSRAAQAVARTRAWMDLGDVSSQALRTAIDSMERSLQDLRVLVRDDSDASFLRFAARYSRARQDVEAYVGSTLAQARLRSRVLDTSAAVMERIAPSLDAAVRTKTRVLGDGDRWNALSDIVVSRARFLEVLGVAGINVRELADRYLRYDRSLYPSLRANADSLGLAVWVRFGRENLPRLRDSARVQLARVGEGRAMNELLAMRRAHAELSAAALELFDAQGSLSLTLLDAYEAYTRRYQTTPGNDTPDPATLPMPASEYAALVARRNALRVQLFVPRSAPSVSLMATDRMMFAMVRADLSPRVTDPEAFFVAEEPSGAAPSPWFLIGGGDERQARFTVWSDDATATSQARVFRVAQRAGAGFQTERTVAYTARFLQPGATFSTGATISAQVDRTPPSAPTFSAPGGREFTAPRGPFAGRRLYYVPSLEQVTMQWRAESPTGVSNWEIGVGTTPDSADVLPLRSLAGRTSFTFSGLSAYAGRPLFWIGRATSGDNVRGPLGASLGVVVDTVPVRIVAPPANLLVRDAPRPSAVRPAQSGATVGLLAACPTGRPAAQAQWFRPMPMPDRNLALLAPRTDGAGGLVSEWLWRVDTIAAAVVGDTAEWRSRAPALSIGMAVGGVPYGRPLVLSLAARNPSGILSAPVASAPFQITGDQTPPSVPSFCEATLRGDTLSIVPAAGSEDPETAVTGYQFAVYRGAQAIRPFPNSTVPDVAVADWQPNARLIVTSRGRPILVPLIDGDTGRITVQVRATNAAGVHSAHSGVSLPAPRLPLPAVVVKSVAITRPTPFNRMATVRVAIESSGERHAAVTLEAAFTVPSAANPQFEPMRSPASFSWVSVPSRTRLLRIRGRAADGRTTPVVDVLLRWEEP